MDIPSKTDLSPGLRQRELCDRLGLNYREVAQTAKRLGFSTHTYLQLYTSWRLHNELYYPPNPPTST
ncbi:MAG: hypothetical protein ACFB0C_03015 [Leptolyngbyaceae cyanobacterium]